jgi:aminoglycoside phosphotransferase (APT) family kinase protein
MTDDISANEINKLEQVVRRIDRQGRMLRAWPLEGGMSAHMTALELMLSDGQTRKVIVRQPGEATLQQNPRAATDEFRLLQMLQNVGLAVPTPYDLDLSGAILATPYFVMEYVEGQPQYTPSNAADFMRQIATHLARIHQVDRPNLDFSFLPKQVGFAEKFGERSMHTDLSSDEGRIRATLQSARNLPHLNESVLLHGDFWPGNLLWKDGRLVAVVDWEDAQVGDPLADFAISRLDIRLIFGLQAMLDFTQHYQSMTTINFAHLPYWDLYAALRAAPHLDEWAAGFPRLGCDDLTEPTLREAHRWFVTQAFEKLSGH